MTKLWQKNWILNKQVEAFETGDDLLLDQNLVWADIAGSLAHAMMLEKIGILTKKELATAKRGLLSILKLNNVGKFPLKGGDEDIHTKIENYLGTVGKKIHTGRSRNDQVLTALRLFTKCEMIDIWEATMNVVKQFVSFAYQYEAVLMPGYTHMQKAMPSTVGLWAASLAESLLDDLTVIRAAYTLIDQSPLGSAAGYGVPIPLDRAYSASLLGFGKVQNNSLYCQNSRGKIEAVVVASLVSLSQTINKFATDVVLFTTSEYGFFTVDETLTTGSSIMPQKKNIDIAELLRSKVHTILSHYVAIVGTSSNLPSGYNRDLQDTKKPLMESLKITKQSLLITSLLLKNIKPNSVKLEAAMTPELFATHAVFEKVKKGTSFRDAYKQIALALPAMPMKGNIFEKKSYGFSVIQKKLKSERTRGFNAKKQFQEALARLGVEP